MIFSWPDSDFIFFAEAEVPETNLEKDNHSVNLSSVYDSRLSLLRLYRCIDFFFFFDGAVHINRSWVNGFI